MNQVVLNLTNEEKCILCFTIKREINELASIADICKDEFSDIAVITACEHVDFKINCLTAVLNNIYSNFERM